ncbi:MAG: MFS transporter [Proteobacteria bacterium]|nr:MFS transporter [Pseudomonadota bacterium]
MNPASALQAQALAASPSAPAVLVDAPPSPAPVPYTASELARYGAPQFALSFVALPLYVFLPEHFAARYAVPLGFLGAMLLLARLADAVLDPIIGRLADHMMGAGHGWRFMASSGVVLVFGFALLLSFPAVVPYAPQPGTFAAVMGLALLLTYAGYSALGVTHQAWGSTLGHDEAERARTFAWRESLGLAGVLVAATVTQLGGAAGFTLVFTISLVLGLWLVKSAPMPRDVLDQHTLHGLRAALEPLHHVAFRRLLLVYLASGVAASVPATLVLFFIRDRIDAADLSGLYLFIYFAFAAACVPLWLRAVRRYGAAASWLLGMALTVTVFLWAALLRPGDRWAYAAVCAASGLALGSDLVLPPALLAGLIRSLGHGGRLEGAYFGIWGMATKLTLALAAGIALPLLANLGYTPGTPATGTLPPLVIAYCLLPCGLKLLSGALLWFGWMRLARNPDFSQQQPRILP